MPYSVMKPKTIWYPMPTSRPALLNANGNASIPAPMIEFNRLSTPDSAEAPAALAVTIISYVLAFGRTYQTSNFALALISPRPFRKFVEISMPTTLTSLPARLETYSCSLSLTLERASHRE